MKAKFILLFTCAAILAACHSNQKTDMAKTAPVDSVTMNTQSYINQMVDEMAPPDSNYTGDFFLKYETGLMKVKGFFRFGKRHGQWFYYYPNGFIWSEALFDNGKMNGPSKAYEANGKIKQEGIYKADKPVGEWNFYDTSGVRVFIRTYDSLGNVLSDKPVAPETKK